MSVIITVDGNELNSVTALSADDTALLVNKRNCSEKWLTNLIVLAYGEIQKLMKEKLKSSRI